MYEATTAGDIQAALEPLAERLRATSPLGFTPLVSDVGQAAPYLAARTPDSVSGYTLVVDGSQTVNANVRKFSSGKSGRGRVVASFRIGSLVLFVSLGIR